MSWVNWVCLAAAIVSAVCAVRAAAQARAARREVTNMSGTMGRIRAEVKARQAQCAACLAGEACDHQKLWLLVAGGK